MRRQADIKEFEQFFQDYYTPVLHYCATIVKDIDDAKDIVQKVFVNVWQKSSEIDIHTSARAYLYKTVYNASLDFLKHEKIKNKYAKEIITNNREAVYSDIIMEKELHQKIQIALLQLPEQCRKIFRMSRLENLKYREIAAELNISEKAVENQMGKALKILKESLRNYLPLLLMLINHYNDK